MNKRILTAIITAASMLPLCTAVNAQAGIQIGDYVQMGNYEGAPILWRCIDIDEYGPLMLSDKIITIKQYDAPGIHTTDDDYKRRQKNGSNRWSDSNLRCWLNSDKPAGDVEWICGNEPSYKNEAGFLTNFSEKEKSAIKTVSHKSVLDINTDAEFAEGGEKIDYSEESEFWRSKLNQDMLKNFDNLLYETVEDTVFLLDYMQLSVLWESGLTYEGFIKYSDRVFAQNTIDRMRIYKNRFYARYQENTVCLRTPAFTGGKGIYSSGYFILTDDGQGHGANGDFSVRPAFYFDMENAVFSDGDGGRLTPYILEGASDFTQTRYTALPTTSSLFIDGKKVSLTAYNIKDNNYFRLRDLAEVMKDGGTPFNVDYRKDMDVTYIELNEKYSGGYDDKIENTGETTAVYSNQLFTEKANRGQAANGYFYFPKIIKSYNVDGYNYCRLRDIGILLNFDVDWNSETNSVYVTTEKE